MSQSNFPKKTIKTVQAKSNQGKPGNSGNTGNSGNPRNPGKPVTSSRGHQPKPMGQAAGGSLSKQEKELLEECLDELYDDYGTYRKSLKPGEEMNVTYQMFLSIVQKLGLRKP